MTRPRLASVFVLLTLLLCSFPVAAQMRVEPLDAEKFGARVPGHGAFVVREVDGKMSCREATPEEAARITAPRRVPVKVFGEDAGPVAANGVGLSEGLNIILRGTAQLDSNPQAKAAFERAAQIWEARIANPITVYVDVDFGPLRFGEAFEENTIASADTDDRGGADGLYGPIRGLLVARGDDAAENAIYGALPSSSLPTDLGATTRVVYPSILIRALGGIPATAAPTDPAPSIGFNSAFSYDFDPSDGIAPGKKDFEGVVVHEIGHMLGFVSSVGNMELGSTINAPSILDFFRFRPGVTSGSFGGAQRIQSSGGTQVYFGGGTALNLSTGRGDGTGGDENQASHWKDDDLTGVRIGIMDPTLGSGERSELTADDLRAFGIMGYNISGGGASCAEAEPNETITNASPLTIGTPCSGSASIADLSSYTITYNDGTTDRIEDVFRVTLSSPAKLKATLTYTNGGADLDLFVFTVSGSTLNVIKNSSTTAQTEVAESDSTLAAGTYYIGISAFSGVSPYTITATTSGGVATPAAPTNLTATPTSQTSIALSWTDNANNETAYAVEGRTGSGAFTEIGTVAANATGANITGLVAGTTYTFRVRARNAAGNSGYSNEATATTQGGSTTCTPSATVACLLDNRFRVSIAYINAFVSPPQPGDFVGSKLVSGSQNPDVATFGISAPLAIEVVVRIQDVRPFNVNRFDIYVGGLTDLEYTVTVTDTQTGRTRTYRNAPGTVGGVVDRSSFAY